MPRSGRRSLRGAIVHRVTWLDERDRGAAQAAYELYVALTLIHLAATLNEQALRFACERVEYERQLDVGQIARTLARMPVPKGIGTLRTVLADTSFETALLDSSLERRLLKLIVESGRGTPVVQHWFDLPEYGRARADLWYPDAPLVIEADGPHHRLPLQRAKDIRRDAAFASIGIPVLRIPDVLLDADPATVLARVDAALEDGRVIDPYGR